MKGVLDTNKIKIMEVKVMENKLERFLLDPTYSTKEHIIFPSNNRFLTKFLTFFFLIHLYLYIRHETIAERLLEKEIIKILIHIHQNRTEEKEVLNLFRVLYDSLNRLDTERFFVGRILRKNETNLAYDQPPYLLAEFFMDYINKGNLPNISISELKNRLVELESKSTTVSVKTSQISTRRERKIDQENLFFLKDQITKYLKIQGRTPEEIKQILEELNDDKEKLLAFRNKKFFSHYFLPFI